ncbi:toxin HicA [Actinotalea sp. Marseille-Q4924]|uniref:toxin HicA n=1 Tax=Actinotalea sp. Marseille-Q4924 TaxID=2866571 RepID=UPI001CE4A3E6|nr:toxin HicA [Actinotalea sp. Marseille-Q4924]
MAQRYHQRYHGAGAFGSQIVAAMRESPRNIRYDDLAKVCEHYFGPPRTGSGSHAVFKTPWPGDPRVNIQNNHGQAKPYQVRQVLAAIDKKEAEA